MSPFARSRSAFVVASTILLATLAGNVAHAAPPQAAVKKIADYLDKKSSAERVLSLVHFGCEYKSHEYLAIHGIKDKPNNFAIDYRYNWSDDGTTDLRFFCDGAGSVYGVEVISTNAVLNQPFTLAQASMKILSQLLLDNSDMTKEQRAAFQRLIDAEDARGLLVLILP